jgi:hypothetical protein
LGKELSENVKQDITEHHRQLQNSLHEYFPPNINDNNWLINPFNGFQKEDFSFSENEQLIDIVNDSVSMQKCSTISLSSFGQLNPFQPSDAMRCHTFHLSLKFMFLPSDSNSHLSTLC